MFIQVLVYSINILIPIKSNTRYRLVWTITTSDLITTKITSTEGKWPLKYSGFFVCKWFFTVCMCYLWEPKEHLTTAN